VAKVSIRTAILQAIFDSMKKDQSIFVIGEGSRVKYSLDYPEILRRFPGRIVTAPVSEAGIVGLALGAAVEGMRPMVDLTFNDLALRAMDEIVNHVAKIHFMTGGKLNARLVIKADFNRPENAQSGNRLEAMFNHFPGLKVVVPSTPSDAYYFMSNALSGEDPVLFFEDRVIGYEEEIRRSGRQSQLPFGKARILKEGGGLTAVSYGYALHLLLKAVSEAGRKDVEVIDLRTLYPLDIDTILKSVARTGRLLVVEPGPIRLGIGAEIGATISERAFSSLRSPIRRIGMGDYLMPAVPVLQNALLPSAADIRRTIEEMTRREGTSIRSPA
jgi:pyruvate/2-oxoglutarate/acetoin dehydrogenase E1 component